jgi:hypothetical protein
MIQVQALYRSPLEAHRSPRRSPQRDTCPAALLVDGHVAVFASTFPSAAGVTAKNDLDVFAATGKVPTEQSAAAPHGSGAGVLRFDLNIEVSLCCGPVIYT